MTQKQARKTPCAPLVSLAQFLRSAKCEASATVHGVASLRIAVHISNGLAFITLETAPHAVIAEEARRMQDWTLTVSWGTKVSHAEGQGADRRAQRDRVRTSVTIATYLHSLRKHPDTPASTALRAPFPNAWY